MLVKGGGEGGAGVVVLGYDKLPYNSKIKIVCSYPLVYL